MPRKNPLPPSEEAICKRLQAFRQSTGIPRKLFAEKVGIRDSVLVSIEHLRTPVRYWVYKAIDSKFPLNPFWLRTGDGVPQIGSSVKDSSFSNEVGRLHKFGDVYDRFLSSRVSREIDEARQKILESIRAVRFITDMTKSGKLMEHPWDLLKDWLSAIGEMMSEVESLIQYSDNTKARLHNSSLTDVRASANIPSVKAQWPLLKKRLQKAAASTPGGKTRLAEFLGLKLSSVSQWLTANEDSAREPGAETALRMLKWVEQQERK